MKTTKRCGEATIADLNDALLAKAVAARVVKCDKLRADTTVVEGNVAYPTDSGLLAKGVAKMAAMVKALQGMGLATRTRFRDRSRSMRRRAHAIGAWLRRRTEDAKDEVKAINAETATIAEATLEEARRVAANAARSLRQAGSDASGKSQALPPGRPERLPPRPLPGPFVVGDPLEGVGHLGHTVEAGFGRPRLRQRPGAHAGRPLRLGQEDGLDRTEPNGVPRLVFQTEGDLARGPGLADVVVPVEELRRVFAAQRAPDAFVGINPERHLHPPCTRDGRPGSGPSERASGCTSTGSGNASGRPLPGRCVSATMAA